MSFDPWNGGDILAMARRAVERFAGPEGAERVKFYISPRVEIPAPSKVVVAFRGGEELAQSYLREKLEQAKHTEWGYRYLALLRRRPAGKRARRAAFYSRRKRARGTCYSHFSL